MRQKLLFEEMDGKASETTELGTSTFVNNMGLPVHRWFRYSAGFSAKWVERVVSEHLHSGTQRVFDPFAGSGTTLLSAEAVGVESMGMESHPFVARVARAKLHCHTDPVRYEAFARQVLDSAQRKRSHVTSAPELLKKCFHPDVLLVLERLKSAFDELADSSPESELTWLTLVSILRACSHVGTAQWQYILPKKTKKTTLNPIDAFKATIQMFRSDLLHGQSLRGPNGRLIEGDARECRGVPDGFATLVISSPPYPNNYDYADATRLEMTFMRQVLAWADLQDAVRNRLVRSCTQHVPEKAIDLDAVLCRKELAPIHSEIEEVCQNLRQIRTTKAGKKTYHLMVATYFLDLAQVWHALRRVCESSSDVCFVIGDSAPYGIYVPVIEWMTQLAEAAGFVNQGFKKLRDRNIKWKNRKHRVPLCEGELWLKG
jgi:hypothetical protein